MIKKRVTLKLKRANPLFEQWLTEWKEEAAEKGYKNQYTFSLALKNLQKYPLPLKSGRECAFLKGFGVAICEKLDDKLTSYKRDNPGLDLKTQRNANVNNDVLPKRKKKNGLDEGGSEEAQNSGTSSTTIKEYIPKHRTGPYAILITLYNKYEETSGSGSMSKAEVIEQGQKLCDKSFTKPDPGSFYTAWSSMKTLLDKNLCSKKGNPPKFQLTEDGAVLGEKLYIQLKVMEFVDTQVEPCCSKTLSKPQMGQGQSKSISRHTSCNSVASSTTTTQSAQANFESVILPPNSFDIILMVDKQEVSGYGRNGNHQTEPLITELQHLNVPHEVNDLKIGDYTWICRDLSSGTELTLPYIIERKRMDDLAQSIKSGRYYEQKFRLKQCGLQNLIYLIENHGRNDHLGLPLPTLQQAAVNTCIQDGFCIKYTDNIKETAEYLNNLHTIITKTYKDKTLVTCLKDDLKPIDDKDDLIFVMEFKEFNKSSIKAKRFTVKDMFVRHLLQIAGISVERALAIGDQYPTPKLLQLAYSDLNVNEGEELLSKLHYGPAKRKLGPAISKIVHQFFTRNAF